MVAYLDGLFTFFRPAFSRHATYTWYVAITIAIMLRTDAYGVSSFVRALGLDTNAYLLMHHFFHSNAWRAVLLMARWWQCQDLHRFAWRLNGRVVFTGDHTKTPKDGRRIPGVVTLHEDSETASKPTFFRGHHWGCIALVTHLAERWFATPLWAELHEGLHHCAEPSRVTQPKTVRIVGMAQRIACVMGVRAYLVLDAFFSVRSVFAAATSQRDDNGQLIHIITRARQNSVAYLPATPKPVRTRGRKQIYGQKLELYKLFDRWADHFMAFKACVYDQSETVQYFMCDLVWKPVKGILRFYWFKTSCGNLLLMSSDLTLLPQDALAAYCRRVTIETLFNRLKNLLGGMTYHFWSKSLDCVSRRPTHKHSQQQPSSAPAKTGTTFEAIEKYVNIHLLALGMLQLLALQFQERIISIANCWMRTQPHNIPSEFVVKVAIHNLWQNNKLGLGKSLISTIIHDKQRRTQAPLVFSAVKGDSLIG